jgi:Domain of unknown function (DUF397)
LTTDDTPAWRKSSYSGGSGGDCIEVADTVGAVMVRDTKNRDALTLVFPPRAWEAFTAATSTWRKSSYSGSSGGNCVEVASAATAVMVRDTKDSNGRALAFAPDAWQAFTACLKQWRKSSYSGSSGGDCIEVASAATAVMVRDTKDSNGRALAFAPDAWQAFTTCLKQWRKSSYSGGSGGDCIEVASAATAVMARDTKDRDGGTLTFAPDAWQAFMASLRH